MKMYFAGGESWKDLLRNSNVKNILCSAYGVKYRGDMRDYHNIFDRVLLDSGGYTARMKGTEVVVEKYANYINNNKITLAFNLDVLDEKISKKNQLYLEKETNAYIIPVYHYSDYAQKSHRYLLDEMIDKYPYISIGGIAGMKLGKKAEVLYDYTFSRTRKNIKVHGLGITSSRVLSQYPFYSVDSTSWQCYSRYGNSKQIKDKKLEKFYLKRKTYLERFAIEIEYFKEMETYITRLWEKRGVKWDD